MENDQRITIYTAWIQTVISIENRRQQVSVIYLTMVSMAFVALGAIKGLDPVYVAIPIWVLSVIWILSIRYLINLSEAKFHVIKSLEGDWELRPFEKEWDYLKKKKYSLFDLQQSHFEQIVPIFILTIVSVYLLFRLWLCIR